MHLTNETLCPLNNSPFLTLPAPGNNRSTFCLYEFDYSKEEPHMSRIKQCLSFSDWFVSLSIISSSFTHVIACVRTPFPFKADCHCISLYVYITFCLSIQTSKDTWLASIHWLSWIIQLWTWVSKYLFEMISISESEIWGSYGNSFFVIFGGRATQFSTTAVTFYFLPNSAWGF